MIWASWSWRTCSFSYLLIFLSVCSSWQRLRRLEYKAHRLCLTETLYLPPTKEEVYVVACVRLSVCLCVSKITQKRLPAWIWMKCCLSTDVGTRTNWLTFEPDPDYSPDAGTRLLSPISYALQRGILLRRESPTYRYWYACRLPQPRVVLTWFYSLLAEGTPLLEVHHVHALHRLPF